MNMYMATIAMPDHKDREFVQRLPAQRAYVNARMEKGEIGTYALSVDRTRLWVTLNAESMSEAAALIDGFPLRKFMRVQLVELMVYHTSEIMLPTLSMN